MNAPHAAARPARRGSDVVVFVVFQTENLANGGVRSIEHVLDRLRAVRPVIVTQRDNATTARWRARGFDVRVWPSPDAPAGRGLRGAAGRAARVGAMLAANARMRALVRDTGARVVHCNDPAALWHAAGGARAAGARVVFTIRGTTNVGGVKWRVAREVSDRVIALSSEMRSMLEARVPPLRAARPTPIDVVYSVVDLDAMSPVAADERARLRARLGVGADEFAVGHVAAFVPLKQQLELIRAVAQAPRRAGARFYFVGDCDPARSAYARACREAVAAASLGDAVRFVGYTPDVADWYRALDAAVVVSRDEGLARCMIESAACGTPVVSFDVCSAREVLEARGCGVVVPQGDFAGVVAALARLRDDAALRARLAGAGPAVARALFAPDAVVRRYESIYLDLMRDGPAGHAVVDALGSQDRGH